MDVREKCQSKIRNVREKYQEKNKILEKKFLTSSDIKVGPITSYHVLWRFWPKNAGFIAKSLWDKDLFFCSLVAGLPGNDRAGERMVKTFYNRDVPRQEHFQKS